KSPSRHSGDDGGKKGIGDQHGHQRGGKHPRQSVEVSRRDRVTNRAHNVVAAENEKMKKESEQERTDLGRLDVDNFVEDAIHKKALSSRACARDLTNAEEVTQVGEILRFAQDDTALCLCQAASTSASRSGGSP